MPRRGIYNRKTNKKVKNASECRVDGLVFKSRLEMFTYLSLKANNIKCDYEKVTFVLQNSFKSVADTYQKGTKKGKKIFKKKINSVREITYTPDFTNRDWGIDKRWVIEVKGFETDSYKIKKKMFLKYLYELNAEVLYLIPSSQKEVTECVEMIKKLENE